MQTDGEGLEVDDPTACVLKPLGSLLVGVSMSEAGRESVVQRGLDVPGRTIRCAASAT